MSTVGYGTLEVIPAVRGLRKDLEKQTSKDLGAAGRTGGKKFGDAAGKEAATGFKGRFSGALKGFNPLAGLAVGAGLVAGFKDIVGQASEAEQAVGGVRAVFGDFAGTVERDSTRAADALGLSSTAYQQLVTVSGALLKNKGLEDFADRATGLVEIGADLAAMFGGSTKEAVEALNAALRGESDPIERYAISLNETAIKAKLAASGADRLTGAALDQAKTQARLAIIMEQSADAQGAFGREADTAAGQSQRLSAEWADLRKEAGEELLPAVTALTGGLRHTLPVLGEAGGLAKDAVSAFASLPAPVLAGAAAFGTLRLASATGLSNGLQSGVAATGSAMDGLRIRTMLAADTWQLYRTNVAGATLANGTVIASNGRVAASMAAVSAATAGAGTAMRTGLSKTMTLVGGPWGAAMIGATALVTSLWQEHEKARAQIDAFNASLDAETGSITEKTYRDAAEGLKGWADAAENAGISGKELAAAVVEGGSALDDIVDRFTQYQNRDLGADLWNAVTQDSKDFEGRLKGLHDQLARGREEWKFEEDAASAFAGSVEDGADATDKAAGSLQTYSSRIDGARTALTKLVDKEDERTSKVLQRRGDERGLREALRAANEEAREGARVLFDESRAADANAAALDELAGRWNDANNATQNAKGAYRDMRAEFIRVAEQMGATSGQAEKLARTMLEVPKTAPIEFQSKGYRERMRELANVKKALRDSLTGVLVFQEGGSGKARRAFASGGKIGGEGTGTSDDNLIWASRGEWVIRERAAAYYGDAFMRRLNSLQLPKFATGGPVSGGPAAAPVAAGVQVSIGRVEAHDYADFMRQMQRRAQMAQTDGVRMGVPG